MEVIFYGLRFSLDWVAGITARCPLVGLGSCSMLLWAKGFLTYFSLVIIWLTPNRFFIRSGEGKISRNDGDI